VLLKQAAGIPIEKKKGGEIIPAEEKAKKSGKYKGFKVTAAQVREIAKRKFNDLNARDEDHAVHIVAGTARSMGITVE
jgi:large subunit ribosomal protein L11